MEQFNKGSEKTILRYSVSEKGIGRLEWNDSESDLNVLSSKTLKELKSLLPQLEKDSLKVLVLVLRNLAGADLRELKDISPEILARWLDEAHGVFNRFESLKATKIAVLKGACLGGGLELALTCDYRLVGNSLQTRLGLPEVRLGLIPGLGGCFRLPRKVGLKAGLEMILSGKTFPANFALDAGLVDEMIPDPLLEKQAMILARLVMKGEKAIHPSQKFKPRGWKNILLESSLLRPFIFFRARKTVLQKTKRFYPAPLQAWWVVKKTFQSSLSKSLLLEKRVFVEMAFTSESRNLIRLFLLKSRGEKLGHFFSETESLLNQSSPKMSEDFILMKEKSSPVECRSGLSFESGLGEIPASVGKMAAGKVQPNLQDLNQKRVLSEQKKLKKRNKKSPSNSWQVGVLGAGVMGGGIARLLVDKGQSVRLRDVREEALSSVFKQADKFWTSQVSKGKIQPWEWQEKRDRLSLIRGFSGFSQMDIVIEALPEDKALKKQALREMEVHLTPDQVVASNTSSLSIGDLASACPCPERFVGMHFFNPVHKIPLVEIVKTDQSDNSAVSRVFHLAKQLGKIPVIVKDSPGFIVNRLLMPYLSEALWLFIEGYNIKAVDRCYTHEFGFPMGPFRLMDEVGLDLCLKVIESFETAGLSVFLPPRVKKILQGLGPGRKQGVGFYRYEKKTVKVNKEALRFQKSDLEFNSTECIHRGLYRLINEALQIREEGVAREEEIDLAGVFGMGFPPFCGGPLKYARDQGFSVIEQGLKDFFSRLGPRFTSDPALFR